MGNVITVPAIPAFSLDYMSVESEFIRENYPWPFIHMTNLFILYYFYQSFWFCGFMILLNEMIEAFCSIFIHSTELVEDLRDALVSDSINGLIGILMAFLLLRAIKWKYVVFPTFSVKFNSQMVRQFFKYFLEFVFFGVSLILYRGYFDHYGIYSLGAVFTPILFVLFTCLAYNWNKDDKQWISTTNPIRDGNELTISFVKTTVNQTSIYKYYSVFATTIVIFLLSFTYRYTHVYIMALIHSFVIVCVLLGIIWVQSPPYKKQDDFYLNK